MTGGWEGETEVKLIMLQEIKDAPEREELNICKEEGNGEASGSEVSIESPAVCVRSGGSASISSALVQGQAKKQKSYRAGQGRVCM